ncbi:hypothetical protein [Paenibacillus bovis]|uniref:Uncharacterized protein n=1 Tax=Paenibacillus bovis TaxID=1616788 RepID=A0A172ZI96_9BACL|nr:hypothetical protein [Paenibacillus bovis]ANF97122.1 hypothetical protein AR543_14670 [Paenibacillus bovis]
MTMKKSLSVVIAFVLMLGFLPVFQGSASAASSDSVYLNGSISLSGPTDVVFIEGIKATSETKLALNLPLKKDEMLVVSYEYFNESKNKWEPRDVRLVHGPVKGYYGTLQSGYESGTFRIAISTSSEKPVSGYYHAEYPQF